jgi:hypothetical protein
LRTSTRRLCALALASPLKKRAYLKRKNYAAMQYDEMTGHSLHKRCVIAQAEGSSNLCRFVS